MSKNTKRVPANKRGNEPKEEAKSASPPGGKAREFIESLIVAIILALIVKTFVLQTFQIPTGSMEDGLLVGDQLIVNKFIYGEPGPLTPLLPQRTVERGEVIIFKWPRDPRIDYVKRVIGLPGETVRISGHQVYIDGKKIEDYGLDEDRYTFEWKNADTERAMAAGLEPGYDPGTDSSRLYNKTFQVPEGHYFVLGDHRSNSLDSRFWPNFKEKEPNDPNARDYRFVPEEHIVGRAAVIYWSYKSKSGENEGKSALQAIGDFAGAVVTFPVNVRWSRLLHVID